MVDFLQRNARFIAAAGLVLLGVWIVHGFLTALAWAVVIAIATWPFIGPAIMAALISVWRDCTPAQAAN